MYGSVDWGDYDGDGDFDLVLSGDVQLGQVSWIYRNDGGGTFTRLAVMLPHVRHGVARWADFDGDGDLDLLIAGEGYSVPLRPCRVYRNDGSDVFTDILATLPGINYVLGDWGDFDNDGDLDLLIGGGVGVSSPPDSTRIYENRAGAFVPLLSLRGCSEGSGLFGDYDNDGDLDVLLTGYGMSKVFRHDGGTSMVDIAAPLVPLVNSSGAWGDFDNDGDLDLLLAGQGALTRRSLVYRNDDGTFVDTASPVIGVSECTTIWGDVDNDGDRDFLVAGKDNGFYGDAKIYVNQGGSFTDSGVFLERVFRSSCAWGDFDRDGDLDLMSTGVVYGDPTTHRFSAIYRNEATTPNTPPSAPSNLSTQIEWSGPNFRVSFAWDAATVR